MSRGISFRWALVARILFLVIPVLLIGEGVMYFEIKDRMFDTAKRDLIDNAEVQAAAVQAWARGLQRDVVLASMSDVLRSGDLTEINRFLHRVKEQLPGEIQCIHFIDAESSLIETSTCPTRIGHATRELPWFEHSVQGRPYISDPFPGRLNFQPVIVFTAPVFEEERQTGILLFAANLFEKTGTMYRPTKSGFTMLTDQHGTILTHPDLSLILGGSVYGFGEEMGAIADRVLMGDKGFDTFLGDGGEEMLVGYSYIDVSPGKRWGVFVVAPLMEELEGLGIIQEVMTALVVFLIAADLAVSLYIARGLARPLESLTATAEKIKQGDLSQRASTDSRVKEIDRLAFTFNDMVSSIREGRREIERLANITESSADAIMSTDEEGRITSWNRGAEQMFGYAKEEILGRHFHEIVPEELMEEADMLRAEASKRGYVRSYQTYRLHKSGRRVPVSLTITVLRDRQGRIMGNAGIFKDLTEKVRADEEIMSLKEFNESIVNNAPMGIFTTDKEGRVTSVNPMFQRMVGDSSVGMHVLELSLVRALGLEERFQRALEGESFEVHKQKYSSEDGELFVSVRAVPLRNRDGEASGVLAVVTDVTEQARLEEEVLKAKNKTIEQLKSHRRYVDEVAHSLRNPLQVFKGNLELINQRALPRRERDLFRRVMRSSREVEKKIKELTGRRCWVGEEGPDSRGRR
jgi:PAS domain S-box-containing protein